MAILITLLALTLAHAAPPDILIPHRLLLVAPHPDDVLMSAGLVLRTRAQGGQVRVVDITCGDARSPLAFKYIERLGFHQSPQVSINYGYFRQTEDLAANTLAGARPGDLVFLGYPDGGTWEILQRGEKASPELFTSATTQASRVPYTNAFSPGAPYLADSVVADLARQLLDFKPDAISVTHPNDNHPDHAAAYYFVQKAIRKAGLDPHSIAIYSPIDEYAHAYPLGLDRSQKIESPTGFIPSATTWYNLTLKPAEIETKVAMTSAYRSQMAWEHPFVDEYKGYTSYMYGYVGQNELYGIIEAAQEDADFRQNTNRRLMVSRALSIVGNVFTDWWRSVVHLSPAG